MNNPIFKREDFVLCDVPVPQGYPQSQTHSGVAWYDGRLYLTSTPYPNRRLSRWRIYFNVLLRKLSNGMLIKDAEIYENPCLYVSDKNQLSEIPTTFSPLAPFPLMDTPKKEYGLPAFNSDPDIFIENGHCYILNRTVCRTRLLKHGYECKTKIFLIIGEVGKETFELKKIQQIKEWNKPYVSPCLIKHNGKYILSYLDTNSAIDAKSFCGLYLQQLSALDNLSRCNEYKEIKISAGRLLPWHMSLFSSRGRLYSIIACVKRNDKSRKIWQMLGEFNDNLTELTIYRTPLTDYQSYRGSAFVREDGLFVLYNTTLWENVQGSKSVDGRNIIVATKSFYELLKEIRIRQ